MRREGKREGRACEPCPEQIARRTTPDGTSTPPPGAILVRDLRNTAPRGSLHRLPGSLPEKQHRWEKRVLSWGRAWGGRG